MPQVLQSDFPLPPAAALLRLPAAHAFGASADAAHLPLDLLGRLLFARPLLGSYPACYTSVSGEILIALAALVAPIAPASSVAPRPKVLGNVVENKKIRPTNQEPKI